MVYVRLVQDWTEAGGQQHSAGELVDVDTATLTELEAARIVDSSPDMDWNGPTGSDAESDWSNWTGPTGDGESESWPGPDA